MAHPSDIHSTGRGGAGNIGKDSTPYTDAGIVREGTPDHAGSAGRGGQGNIHTPTPAPAGAGAGAGDDVVPETDLRAADAQPDFHTGRGGAGNEHRERFGGHSTRREQEEATGGAPAHAHKGLLGKVKEALGVEGKEGKS